MTEENRSSASDDSSPFSELVSGFHRRIYDAGLAFERYRSRLTPSAIFLDGQEWSYLEREGSQDTIVLIHGFTGSKDAWIQYARHLPRRARLVIPDLMGHGENRIDLSRPHDAWSVVAILNRTLRSLGFTSFHLAGHSLGGMLAAAYAAKHPEDVKSLFLACPAGAETSERSPAYELIDAGDNPFFCSSRADFDRLFGLIFHGEPPVPGIARTFLAREHIARRELHVKMWSDLHASGEKIEPILARVRARTRVVWGQHDEILHPSSMETFTQGISGSEGRWLNCGHGLPIERPIELAELHSEHMRTDG